jgi:succinate dehydrogenase/fumarate reductase-like Fe-S protein
MVKYITVRGIFEDPTSLKQFTNCVNGNPCYSNSDPYPLNLWMWEYIKPQILNQLMQKGANQQDDSNNAEDGKTELTMASNAGQ